MDSKIKKIVFIHSLNNYTGSPNVLSVVIKGFVKKGYDAELITSRGDGFLSDLDGVDYRYTCYRWLDSKVLTALLMLMSQIQLFFMILFLKNEGVIYYVNTIVPVGAAWACKLTNKRMIYHVHENMQLDKPIYPIFKFTYKHCNQRSIFVSEYLKQTAVNCRNGTVIYNSLSETFIEQAEKKVSQQGLPGEKTIILMIASYRRFKGIYEFVELSKQLTEYQFELVLNASEKEVESFKLEADAPKNISIFPSQNNVHKFYERARLLLQLSHPESWVETFGLTILEAMVYGVPAIVPNVGGPTELIENGVNGYQVNPHDLEDIAKKIRQLMEDEEMYKSFSKRSLERSRNFNEQKMLEKIESYILSDI